MSASGTEDERPAARSDPIALLDDLPVPLWGELLRALRRATDRLPRAELPVALRPFAGWTPDSLAAERPRRVIARAVVAEPRLREEIAAAVDDTEAVAAAGTSDATRLAATHGDETAVAALTALGRWEELAVVAANATQRLAARQRSAAEASRRRSVREERATRQRLDKDLTEARQERDVYRRRAQAAEERLRQEAAAGRDREEENVRLRAQVSALTERLAKERSRRQRRVGRLRQRLQEAQERARVDEERARRAVGDLERLTEELRAALGPEKAATPGGEAAVAEVSAPQARTLPRAEPAATPGRPCRLPAGVASDGPAGVRALLQVSGLEIVLDGYNVTKDRRGRPHATLAAQRQWLVKLAAGVAARFRRRITIVFDGTEERLAPTPAARDVRVVFTAGQEIADERIVGIVDALRADVPVLVVSSDREVREAAEGRGANSAPSAAFLTAVE